MAMNFTSPIPKEAVDYYGSEYWRHPVGCGPFALAEWTPKLRVVLRRNPTYRPEFYPSEGDPGDREAGLFVDAGKRLPLAEKSTTRSARARYRLESVPPGLHGRLGSAEGELWLRW